MEGRGAEPTGPARPGGPTARRGRVRAAMWACYWPATSLPASRRQPREAPSQAGRVRVPR